MKTLFLLIDGVIMKPSIQDEKYFEDYHHIVYESSAYYVKSKREAVLSGEEILQCNQMNE
jgi:hypothetical protein